MEREIALAWVAGFLDGEGSTSARKTKWGTFQFHLECHQKGREPLDRLQKTLGGKVYVSKTRPGIFKWSIQSKEGVRTTLLSLWPFLTEVKKNQVRRCYLKAGEEWNGI